MLYGRIYKYNMMFLQSDAILYIPHSKYPISIININYENLNIMLQIILLDIENSLLYTYNLLTI